MRLLHTVTAFATLSIQLTSDTPFIVRYLPKASVSNVFQFAVLPSMGDHFIGVRANEITFHAMEMGRLVVVSCVEKREKLDKMEHKNEQTRFDLPIFLLYAH